MRPLAGVRIPLTFLLFPLLAPAQLRITTSSVPVATQYQSYNTTLTATGGAPPYTWSVVASTGVSLPEGMSLNSSTGVVSASHVAGQGGYAATIQVTDSGSNTATAVLDFGVNSDSSLGGCQMFPADSIYNQRIDLLPVDTTPSHQIPSALLSSPLHPDFGAGFYPVPGGIPFIRVPANQPLVNVNLAAGGQLDGPGTYSWPFPPYPNLPIEDTSGSPGNIDHHMLILQTSSNDINGPQTGACTLYETYQSTAAASMFDPKTNTWLLGSGVHYDLGSNEIAQSEATLDNGAQDSAGIPMLPLLLRYSEVPLAVHHPLRIGFPAPTDWFVWPATGCCGSSGPPQGLLYRLKAGVNWQAACPVATNPQAATVLQAMQQYGAYMSDHGGAAYIGGVPDARWNDADLACIKNFHASDLEVVDNSALEISDLSGQTRPYIVPAAIGSAAVGTAYSVTFAAVGGNPATLRWSVASGKLPPGLALDPVAGTIAGTPISSAGSPFPFTIVAIDGASGQASNPQSLSLTVGGSGSPFPDLTITMTHSGNFKQGQTGAVYTLTAGNSGGVSTSGTVTVTASLPVGLTLVSMAGTGWTCAAGATNCTRSDALASGASYPAITATVNIAMDAPLSATASATVSGGGEVNTANDAASDLTHITSLSYRITTASVPVATQYQSYSTTLSATGGAPPYTWSLVTSTFVSLPEGMSLNPSTGVVSASQVTGQGGYAVTVQVSDSGGSAATATLNFAVNSDSSFAGCQMFPPDSIYNQRSDLLPVDANPAHQIESNYLSNPLHPDFGVGFYPVPGGIPFMRVPANQPLVNVNLSGGGQMDQAGTYSWPFPTWPNVPIEDTSLSPANIDHHILILQTSTNDIDGPQTGPCTLYETYQFTPAPTMFNAQSNTWQMSAGVHYLLNSDVLAASDSTLDNGAQDSAGIPIVPLLLRYSEVPLGANHPLRIAFPNSTNSWVWPATGCCSGSGPPQGLLYRLKASVNWQLVCPVATYPQAATVLQALQQYGAYMSDHGGAAYVGGVPDARWNDADLACIKNLHAIDLEVVDNSMLEVSELSGQTRPYVVPAALGGAAMGTSYLAILSAVGGNPGTRQWSVTSGNLPPGLSLDPVGGTIAGVPTSSAGSPYQFAITATDTASANASSPQAFSIAVSGGGLAGPAIASVTNSASGASGAVAPGELVTITGSLLGPSTGVSYMLDSTGAIPPTLAGTQVTFGSWAAPILYASATQINAIVPWEVGGQSQVVLKVQSAWGISPGLSVPVTNGAPGIFTLNSAGTGPVVAANQDGSYNRATNPASPGSYVTLYFTGGGVTNPPGATGSVSGSTLRYLTQELTATVGGTPAAVEFAGAAPGFVDGVGQLNLLLAANTPAGNALPVVIKVAGRSSPSTATLSVH